MPVARPIASGFEVLRRYSCCQLAAKELLRALFGFRSFSRSRTLVFLLGFLFVFFLALFFHLFSALLESVIDFDHGSS